MTTNFVPVWVCLLWFFAALMFGHTSAKYTRAKRSSRLIGALLLIAAFLVTVNQAKP